MKSALTLLLLLYIHEAEKMSRCWKPSALGLSALLSTYCLMTLLTHWHNNNNANDSNNVIMHRHPPTEGQYAAYNSAADNGITAWRAAGPATVYRAPPRPQHTHCLLSLVLLCISSLSTGTLLLCQGPTKPPPPSTAATPFVRLWGIWLLAEGALCEGQNPLHSIRRCPPNTGPHAHAFRFTTRGRCPHVQSHLCREPLWPDRRWSSGTHGNMEDNSTTLRNERKAAGGLSEQIIRLPTQPTLRWWTIVTTPFCHNITVKTTPLEY